MAEQQQRNRGSNRGGQPRQGGQNAPQTKNQEISNEVRRKEAFIVLMSSVEKMRMEIVSLLPAHVSFDKFRNIVMMAVRRNQVILDCHMPSIINACLYAAYDGLMPDGREGAMIPSKNKYDDNGVTKWREEVRWSPMIAGIRKQILAGGQVRDFITTMVYANEIVEKVEHEDGKTRARFHVVAGTEEPKIFHVPITEEARRGEMAAVYSVAFFHDGRPPTFEIMYRSAVEAVRDSSQSGAVWKGAYVDQMWRKTVARRHRKSLPGCNDIIDMEAVELFPQFQEAGHELPSIEAGPRPTRKQFAIADEQGTEAGVHMDFGGGGDQREAVMSQENGGEQQQGQQREVEHDPATGEVKTAKPGSMDSHPENPANADDGLFGNAANASDPNRAESLPIPKTPAEWDSWLKNLEPKLLEAKSLDEINVLRRKQEGRLAAAPANIAELANKMIFDALSDFPDTPAAAGPADKGKNAPAGDQ